MSLLKSWVQLSSICMMDSVGQRITACLQFARSPNAFGTSQTHETINAHRCAMRLQRRLSTAFAAAGPPALRPNSLARTSQMPGPLYAIELLKEE